MRSFFIFIVIIALVVISVEGKAWEFDGTTKIDMDYPEFKEAATELSVRCFILPLNTKGQHIIFEEGGAWAGICLRIMDGKLQLGLVCCDAAHPPVEVISTDLPDAEDWIEIPPCLTKERYSSI